SVDESQPVKQLAARKWVEFLWETGAGCLSWQVLHEFYVNCTRKFSVPHAGARATVEAFAAWQPIDVTLGLVQRAWWWIDEAQIPYWDALIVAAAERAGCGWLLSEDFQTGRQLGGITIVSPFRSRPEEFASRN